MITRDLIKRCSSKNKVRNADIDENYQAKLTHLYMQERGLENIDNLHGCTNLLTLYLHDNKINKIQNLHPVVNLSSLYLQNNCISKIENLSLLRRLRRLYLGKNSIFVVQGLEYLTRLEELSIPNQTLPEGQSLLFDLASIHAISKSLKILDIAGNNIKQLDSLRSLNVLEELHAEKNQIQNLSDITQTIKHWKHLKTLHLKENPVCSLPRYKEHLLPSCLSLENIDGKHISDSAKIFSCKMMENNLLIRSNPHKTESAADVQRKLMKKTSSVTAGFLPRQTTNPPSIAPLDNTFAKSLTIDGSKFGGN